MSTQLTELVRKFNESNVTLDGKNDYGIADTFLRQEGIRANNKQVWTFINEAKQTAGEEADW